MYRLRDFYFVLGVTSPNMSDLELIREIDNKGKEVYRFKTDLIKEKSNPEHGKQFSK